MFAHKPVWYFFSRRHHPGYRSGPSAANFCHGYSAFQVNQCFQLGQIGGNYNQATARVSALQGQHPCNSLCIPGLAAQTIYGFCRVGDYSTTIEDTGCFFNMPGTHSPPTLFLVLLQGGILILNSPCIILPLLPE